MLATVESVKNYVIQMGCKLTEDMIRDMVRECYTVISRWHEWDYRMVQGQITAVADYDTGTVAVTQGSKDITFTGSTLIPAMITRSFQASGTGGRWYQFKSINTGAGTAVLVDPYEGTTDSAATFTIRQRFYRLPPDFDKAEVGKETQGYKVVFWKSRRQFEQEWATISASGQVWSIVPAGIASTVLYNTGTFSATQSSAVVTVATGTVNSVRDLNRRFRAPRFPHLGDFTIIDVSEGGNTYTLDRVWTDRTVTTQYYEVDPIGEPIVEPYPSPTAGNSSIMFFYYRVPPPLWQDTDYPNWPAEMNQVWKDVSLVWCSGMTPSEIQAETAEILKNFMVRQGYEKNEVVGAGRYGTGTTPPGSNLPWNFPATNFWGGR